MTQLQTSHAARVLGLAEEAGLELIRFLYVDHGGLVRGKSVSRARLGERMRAGVGLTVAMQAASMLDDFLPIPEMGPVGEVRLVPDPASFVVLPYAPGAGAMAADLVSLDGSAYAACPRTFLKQAIAALASKGFALVAALEPEFTLGRRVPISGGLDRLEPLDATVCFSTTGFDAAHDYVIELVRALQAQGLEVEQYYPEYGHGQHELSIRYAPALRAADRQVTYRETVRGVAGRHGLWATLAPKPIPDQAGNGAHVHLSLWDLGPDGAPGSQNVLFDPDDRLGLSDTAYHFIAGVLHHLPALVALTCGSVNSYRRLQPQSWSSAFGCFGMDNREATMRIASPLWGNEEASTNLELKASDSTGNPYLALGGIIHAGLDGIRRKLDPGEPISVDPATLSPGERAARGIHRLPESLGAALDALAADEFLMDALGPLRSTAYLMVKRSEVEAFGARDVDYECFHHFTKF